MKKIVLLISLISLLFISCENTLSKIENPSLVENSTNTPAVTTSPSEDGKTYITFGDISFENESRTINPVYNRDDLTALYIKGMETSKVTPSTKANDYTTLFGLYSSNPKATSYDDLCTKTFEITPGIWNFILCATLYDFEFAGTTTVEIKPGMTHALNFTLATTNTSSYPYGIIDITVDFTGNADKVVATLKEKSTSATAKLTKTYTATDTTNPISTVEGETFRRINFKTAKSSSSGVTTGKYYLLLEFFKNGTETPVNTVENIVRVENNFTTKTTLNLDLDELYTITYSYWEGSGEFYESELENLTFTPTNTVLPSVYSRKSETFILPTPSLPGYSFDAWYKDTDFTEENKITQITQGSTGDLELHANFVAQGSGGNGGNANILDGFVLVTGGRVDFAITDSDPFGEADKNAVYIQDLYVCEHEVTQAEYETYCTYDDNEHIPTQTSNKDKYPVYYVNWYDAIIYCNLRSMADTLNPVYSINGSKDPATWPGIGKTDPDNPDNNKFYGPSSDDSYQWDYYTGSYVSGIPPQDSVSADFSADGYRLPTVAEWEYIARGGNSLSDETIRNYTYSGGNSLSSIGYSDNQVHEIKSKDPNTLDIYDMSNSIGEWCYGWTGFEADYRPAKDYNAEVKSSYSELSPSEGNSNLGFRVVRSAKVKAFSVSADKKITFSPANMEASFETYTYSGGSSTTTNWIFANHQYDIVGSDNSKIGTDDQTIDLMGWGTSNYSNCTITSSSTTASYGPDGEVNLTGEGNEKYDWGIFNSFENGGKDSYMWRTLSKNEWDYLLNSRTNAPSKYGVAQVNNVNGLILLPDEWELPDGLTFNSGTAASGGTYASKNTYTADQWKQMEINGAIFLPAAGSRTETTVTGAGETGEYWTTTADGSNGAYYITFTADSVDVSEASNENNHRYVGRAVRLVHEITTSN